jgi:hypothetical protein
MTQFAGEVQFGLDPKGILFYNDQSDFDIGQVNYRTTYHRGPGTLIAVRVDFFVPDDPSGAVFTRFLARVDTAKYRLPRESAVMGNGRWRPLIAATTQTDIHKVSAAARVRLRFPPIRRQVLFNLVRNDNRPIKATGVTIFPDREKLQNVVGGSRVVADFAPDRIVFHPENNADKFVALFLPAQPIDLTGGLQVTTSWSDFNPDDTAFAEEEGHFAENVEELQEA